MSLPPTEISPRCKLDHLVEEKSTLQFSELRQLCDIPTAEKYRVQNLSAIQYEIALFYHSSKIVAPSIVVERGATFICHKLATVLRELHTPEYVEGKISFEESPFFKRLHMKIVHFFKVIQGMSFLITTELIHVFHLIDILIDSDIIAIRDGWTGVVSETNLGTLLLCGVILSLKYNRDIAFKNSWWSKAIGIPLAVINQSELVFLQRVNFSLSMSEERFLTFIFAFFPEGRLISCPLNPVHVVTPISSICASPPAAIASVELTGAASRFVVGAERILIA